MADFEETSFLKNPLVTGILIPLLLTIITIPFKFESNILSANSNFPYIYIIWIIVVSSCVTLSICMHYFEGITKRRVEDEKSKFSLNERGYCEQIDNLKSQLSKLESKSLNEITLAHLKEKSYMEKISDIKSHFSSKEKDYLKLIEDIKSQFSSKEKIYEEKILGLTNEINKLVDTSNTDELTGVRNRKTLKETIKKQMENLKEASKPCFSVIFIDIDNFARFNKDDHILGDAILRQVGSIINDSNRGDFIFRFGGDEFVIVSRLGTDEIGGYSFATRIQREISEYAYIDDNKNNLEDTVTVSCGVTICEDGTAFSNDICKKLISEASFACNNVKKLKLQKKLNKINNVEVFKRNIVESSIVDEYGNKKKISCLPI